MKYVQPLGEADPNASYKDRNTGAGEPGSRVPAKAIENPQREIVTVLTSVGLEPDGNRVDQLNEAIDLKIDLVTGGGENPLNDLLNLLRARLKIYPEILTADGRFNLTVPSTGNVRIPAGIEILHRGVFPITTAEQTFATVANKTYHLRYRFTGTPGWSLVDVSDSGYNPSALPEANSAFDTGYDDMISHRVMTDASNVATITALANKDRLDAVVDMTAGAIVASNTNTARQTQTGVYDFARTPKRKGFTRTSLGTPTTPAGSDQDEYIYTAYPGSPVYDIPADRYQSTFIYARDHMTGSRLLLSVGA